MSLDRIDQILTEKVNSLKSQGINKGDEHIITGLKTAAGGAGPRYLLAGYGNKEFLRFNSNSYLGLSGHPSVVRAEASAADRFGTGPGAVRFISGTYQTHIDLEARLAEFHGRESAMLYSAAYSAMTGILPQFISEHTLVVSDELNHSCIINAIRLAKPANKAVYPHADVSALDKILAENRGKFKRVCVVTDGIFSMRGDHVEIGKINACCRQHENGYEEGIITFMDDSHGVGAFGLSGRGTEEVTGSRADILVATLGKSLGVNGGYIAASAKVTAYLRETSPTYIYSNPIAPAEAAAALAALNILDSEEGLSLLDRSRKLSRYLRENLAGLGFETLTGEHPIVPLFIRDTPKTTAMVRHLFDHGILATGLNYPVVPQSEQEIRLQVNAVHTESDIDFLLETLSNFRP